MAAERASIIGAIQKVTAELVVTTDLQELLQRIVETFRKISRSSACSVFLVDEDRKGLRAWRGHR